MSAHQHGDDAAAYALGSLEPAEAEAFRRHLDECVVCRDEVAAFRETVGALPAAAPQYRAPRALRRRVMRAVQDDARKRRSASQPTTERRRGRLAVSRPAAVTALASAAAIGVAAFAGVELASSPGSAKPRAVVASLGDAQLRVTGTRAELIVHHLPAPGAGRIYELWLKRGNGAPQPTNTLFSVSHDGTANIGVPQSVTGDTSVLVTAEPAGGTQAPTTAPVIVARVS